MPGVSCDCLRCLTLGKITLLESVSSHQGASNSLLIELGGVSVVRVKRFQGKEDAIEQDTYCSVAGKTSQQEKVMKELK